MSAFAERKNILPEYQFGFREGRSTMTATAILRKCVDRAFEQKKRLFACFVDYTKAFDLVNREKLLIKMQHMGFPFHLCKIIYYLLTNLKFQVRSNDSLTPEFESFNGVPQGDPLSPLLFSLMTADLPESLHFEGAEIAENKHIRYTLYADDCVILSNCPYELQDGLNSLSHYAQTNNLTVNTAKTKCLTFYKGVYEVPTFMFNNEPLENCNNFTYLGVTFTTRLAAYKHVERVVSKCNSRVAMLFSKLPLNSIPIHVAITVFNMYVRSILTYCLPIWFRSIDQNSINKINALYTKFLKRCLGVPKSACNAKIHYILQTEPLCNYLHEQAQKMFYKIPFPTSLNGVQFHPPHPHWIMPYRRVQEVPTYFWISEQLSGPLPTNAVARRALMYEILDLYHHHVCRDADTHHGPLEDCRCKLCGRAVGRYHFRDCTILFDLPPIAKLRLFGLLK